MRPFGFGAYRLGDTPIQKQTFTEAALRYKKSIVSDMARDARYTVKRGPFKGLKLPEMGAWSDYDILSKIVGSYEAELFSSLDRAVSQKPDIVINIGASEGYYAIGLKRLLHSAKVFTFDIDEKSFPVLDHCAQLNGVDVTRLENFDFARPLADIPAQPEASLLFLADCEGAENDFVKMPSDIVRRSAFIVELHDLFIAGTTERLTRFLCDTHVIEIIDQQDRNIKDYPELDEMNGSIRHVLLDEFRATPMQWLYATPKK